MPEVRPEAVASMSSFLTVLPPEMLPKCCSDMDLLLEHLVFPERMSPEGREFIDVVGLDEKTLAELRAGAEDAVVEGKPAVKLKHICKQLLANGDCGIYESRPAICRAFNCAARADCACGGSGRIPIAPHHPAVIEPRTPPAASLEEGDVDDGYSPSPEPEEDGHEAGD